MPYVTPVIELQDPWYTRTYYFRNTGTKIDGEKHRNDSTFVGMIIYLVKHAPPNIANALHELLKALYGTSPVAYK